MANIDQTIFAVRWKTLFVSSLEILLLLSCRAGERPAANASSSSPAIRFDFSPSPVAEAMKKIAANRKLIEIPRSQAVPSADGLLPPEVWGKAALIDAFVFSTGAKASPPTHGSLMFDENNIYVAVECDLPAGQKLDSPPSKAPLHDSSTIWREDCVELWFRPASPSGKEYQFAVSASGNIYDLGDGEAGYNPEWKHAVSISPTGWKVELAIPKEALELAEWPSKIYFNVGRNGPYVSTCSWTGSYGEPAQGELKLEGIKERKRTEKAAKPDQTAEAGSGGALETRLIRSYARPGERWIAVGVEIRCQRSEVRSQKEALPEPEFGPAREAGKTMQLTAEIFPLGSYKPVAQSAIAPDRDEGKVLVDLRRLNLSEARLVLKLDEGGKETGIREMYISARDPEKPLKAGQKIKVLLDVPAGIDGLKDWPVTFGVPFAAGTLWDANDLRLVDKNGKGIPAQVEVSGLWAPEGAVKWARFDALVAPENECYVEIGGKSTHPGLRPPLQSPGFARGYAEARRGTAADPLQGGAGVGSVPSLTLTEKDGKIIADTGVAVYTLGKGISPIMEILLGGKKVATSEKTRGLYVVDQQGRLASASADGEEMLVESRGPVAACVRFEGDYKTEKGEQLARHITRVECFAGQAAARVTHTLILTRDSNEVWLKEIGWEFSVLAGPESQAIFGTSANEHEKNVAVGLNAGSSAYMLQDNHYFFAHGTNHFMVASINREGKTNVVLEGGAAPKKSTELAKGDLPPIASEAQGGECGDWAALAGGNSGLELVCRDAARQHPKEFEIFEDRITLKLFSSRAGEELDFRFPALIKKWDLANWYEKITPASVREKNFVEGLLKFKSNAIGWSKTHEILVNPVTAAEAQKTAPRSSRLFREPVYALADPWWIYASKAMGPLYPRDPKKFPEVESAQEAAFRFWMERDKQWGENGFVDYFAGPHQQYVGYYADLNRYAYATYTVRPNLWRLYVRSGSRARREYAEGSNRTLMDMLHMHAQPPKGSVLVQGLFRTSYDRLFDVPIYWAKSPAMEIQGCSSLNNCIWYYHLTGYRRAKDVVREYVNGVKSYWTPEKARRTERVIALLRLLVESYEFTWAPELRAIIDATADLFEDREGDLGLTKEGRPLSSSYKTMVDVRGLIDAWEVLGEQRYYDMTMKVSQFWWNQDLGTSGIGYSVPMAVIGNWLDRETLNPAYAQALAVSARHNIADYDPENGTFKPDRADRAPYMSFLFEIDYALDALARSGADERNVAAWVGCNDFGNEVSVLVQKPKEIAVDLFYRTPVEAAVAGSVGGGVRLRAVNPESTYGQDLNRVMEISTGAGVAHIPKDAPGGAYELTFRQKDIQYVFADRKVPLVLHAPDYWWPMPPQRPAVKWFFCQPASNQDAQIFFEGAARIYDPEGKPWEEGRPLHGWVNLPADKPGIWSFAPVTNRMVRVRNLPPFFAAESAKNYFTPPIAWEREKVSAPRLPLPAGTLYVPGAIETPDNKALYLTGKRTFSLEAGPPHPSGDGGRFLPFKQGTIEFYIKPDWGTFDLPESVNRNLVSLETEREPWTLAYIKDPRASYELGSHVLLGYFMSAGPHKRISVRTYRRTIFVADQWTHVAWVWGERENADVARVVKALTTQVFVNGRLGRQYSYGGRGWEGNLPADLPRRLVLGPNAEAAYDELRLSDIQRYTQDFTPPSREREFTVDKHTRALYHFNGDVLEQSLTAAGQGYGGDAPVATRIKE